VIHSKQKKKNFNKRARNPTLYFDILMGRFENQGAAVLNGSAIGQCGRLLLMRASKIPREKKKKKKKKKKKASTAYLLVYGALRAPADRQRARPRADRV
jgi:hypothetical protein